LRILYDHQVFSLQNAGGASRYHYELARNLSARPDVYVSAYLGLNGNVHPFASLDGARVLSIRSTMRPGMARYATNEALTGIRGLLAGRWDIYHPTLYRSMPYIRRAKMVVTHHDCTHERFPELFPDVKRIMRAKTRLFSSADAIICVSESSRRDLLQFYSIDPKKTHVIHHGLEPTNKDEMVGRNFMQNRRRPFLLYVGARHGYKNFVRLLHAYASAGLAKDYDLLAVGGGEWTANETEMALRLNIFDCMSLLPIADDNLLAEAYSRAALFVYPSLYEGFGFPPLEAMSAGCLTAVGRTSSLPEVCGEATFYFDPADESSIEKCLQEALNSETREEKIKAGTQRVRTFSWSRCAEQTLQVYQSN
jgi:glycosyltransferase involved in cell wall biosynthesis